MPVEHVELVARGDVDVPLDHRHREEMPRNVEMDPAPAVLRPVDDGNGARVQATAATRGYLRERLHGVEEPARGIGVDEHPRAVDVQVIAFVAQPRIGDRRDLQPDVRARTAAGAGQHRGHAVLGEVRAQRVRAGARARMRRPMRTRAGHAYASPPTDTSRGCGTIATTGMTLRAHRWRRARPLRSRTRRAARRHRRRRWLARASTSGAVFPESRPNLRARRAAAGEGPSRRRSPADDGDSGRQALSRVQLVRGDLRPGDHGRERRDHRPARRPARPAVARPHLPQGQRADRPPRRSGPPQDAGPARGRRLGTDRHGTTRTTSSSSA